MDDVPSKLGGYIVEHEIGRGGMGVVYLAKDPRLQRPVAIKALNDELGEHPDRLARFEREARTLAAINNANIAVIYGLEEHLGRQLLIMEYVPGRHLGEHVRRNGPLSPEDTASICVQIAAGLEAAHETGIVHRDLKPANVRIRPDGVVKLLDFGLAKPEQEMQKAFGDDAETMSMAPTAEGRIMGTAGYMSPEQARGKNVDKRADIWSFGTVLFECLTGHRAFKGETPMDALVAILEKEPPWELLPPKTPEPIRALLTRCLEKDARKRLRDIGDARIDLEDLLRSPRTLSISRAELQPDVLRIQKPLLRAETEEQARPGSGSVGGSVGPSSQSRIPIPLTSFVGRLDDLDAIRGLLGEARLLTLTGPGGCGKSRLAIECARRHDSDFVHGSWYVDLANINDELLVASEIGKLFGLIEADGRPMAEQLAGFIGERDMMVVLDNCEHISAGVRETVASLLAECPNLRLIATTREAMGHNGEWVYRVGVLKTPDDKLEDIEEVAGCDSVRLFLDRTRAVKPDFVLDEGNVGHVKRICRQLDGLPLAIELAAARMKLLGPDRIAERLRDRFKLLRSRSADPRQQTLLAAIEWSFEHLDETERTAMRRLSVFHDGATLDAAETVVSAEYGDDTGLIEDWEVLDVIEQLVDKSMLTVVEPTGEGPAGEIRYRVLESIREVGVNKLEASGELETAQRAHLRWCARLATHAEAQVIGRDQRAWFERLELEHDNIRAALDFICGSEDPELTDHGRTIGAGVWRFWAYFGHIAEGRRTLLRLDRLGEGGEPTPAWARLRQGIATIAMITGNLPQAVAFAVAGLDMARESGDQRTIANLLESLGWACLGDLLTLRARDYFEESREIRRGLGDRVLLTMSICGLAACAHAGDQLDEAEALYGQAEDVLRGAGEGLQAAAVQAGRGWLLLDRDEPDAAAKAFSAACTRRLDMGAMTEIPATIEALASITAARGDHEKAVRLFAAAGAGRERLACPASPFEQERTAPYIKASKEGLAPQDAERARDEGMALSLHRAVRHGLETTR